MNLHRLLALAVCCLVCPCMAFAHQAKPEPTRVPDKLPERVAFQPDLAFAVYGKRELKLDLFAPKDGKGPFPALVLIHGGGWQGGNKTELRPLAQQLAARGYVCVCIEHRLSGEATFPAAIQDCKAAVRWLRAHAEKHRIDPNRIGGVGGSTGGHLVNLLATSAGVAQFEGEGGHANHSSAVQSIVNFAGTMDMTMPHFIERTRKDRNDPAVKFLGATYDENPKLYTEASPITYIGKQTPPMLHIDGEQDRPAFRTEMSRKLLKDLGIKTDLIVIKNGPHAFWLFEPYFTPLVEDVAKWFGDTLKRP